MLPRILPEIIGDLQSNHGGCSICIVGVTSIHLCSCLAGSRTEIPTRFPVGSMTMTKGSSKEKRRRGTLQEAGRERQEPGRYPRKVSQLIPLKGGATERGIKWRQLHWGVRAENETGKLPEQRCNVMKIPTEP